jgi:putative FmdB family regulatory protein
MPTYGYRCPTCATEFEVSRPMSAKGDECCPKCGAVSTRLFTPVGVAFKGTGFHNTDYRTRPKEETGEPAAAPAPACPAKAEGAPACASCPAAAAE